MRLRLLLVLLLLPLTSCINVDDFGTYWDQTDLDPQLKGKWKRIATSPGQTRENGYPIGEISELVEKDGAFEVTTRSPTGAIDLDKYTVKTLTTGRHRWLAIGQQVVGRYQLAGGYLDICPIGDEMAEFARSSYPGAANLEVVSGMGLWVHIKLFDATDFALLRDYPGPDHCTAEMTLAKFEKAQ